jgi:methionine synthase I (cobalamin-dependent)/5,10-methylenetetrahydrofolate reductase
MGINTEKFREVLRNGDAILLDGATGTELYNRGIFINRCFEDANLSNPELVRQLHLDYVQAGAHALTTNSWGANSFKLAKHNLHDRVTEINRKSAELAREVIGDQGFVIGSVGPLGVRMEPWGPTSFEEARQSYREQIKGLADGGVDAIALETFSDMSEIQQAILACRDIAPTLPVMAHLVIDMDGHLTMGSPVDWAFKKLDEWKVDVVGLNCSVGPQPMMSVLPKIRTVTDLPISFRPNAGMPKLVDGRSIYMCTPEYMAEHAKNFLQAGVQFVGGCCGTSPEHIKAMSAAFRHRRAMAAAERPSIDWGERMAGTNAVAPLPGTIRVPASEKSRWAAKIAAGQPVYSVELLPPAGVILDSILAKSAELKKHDIDAINIPDGPRASARMSAILTAVAIEQRVGIETVLHYTCRDRNLLGMQSDVLGAHAIGLRNLLLVTGDPPKMGSYPDCTGVFDIDAIGLTNMVNRLNGGTDLGGRSIGQPTAISIGVGVNPVHRDFEYEMKRFKYKVEAGAEWAITQPVFDINALYKFLEFIEKHNIRIPIVAGIWPLVSFKNAQFMNNEVPGVVIPDSVLKRMAAPQDPEDAKRVGVEIAREMVEEMRSSVQGFQISAPFGRIDLALAVIGK